MEHILAPAGRQPLYFSLVTFPEDDIIGKILAWITLVPLGFFVIEFSFVIVAGLEQNHRKRAFLILLGQLLNEIFSDRVKEYFQEYRPNRKIILFTQLK